MRIRSALGKGTIVLVRFPDHLDPTQRLRGHTPVEWHKLPLPALVSHSAPPQKMGKNVANFA
jgi:hypothetical protein